MSRRAPKLRQAVLSQPENAAIQNFSITDFSPFALLVDRDLTAEERDDLTELARKHLFARAIEINSPKAISIKNQLAEVKKAAGALRQALIDTGTNSVGFFSGRALSEALKDRPLSRRIGGQVDANTLALLMTDVERACDKAARSSVDSHVQATSWIQLVSDLRAWAETVGIAANVSKRSQGKSGRLSPSLFVRLVEAVQRTFPEDLRQHMHSIDALSQAIIRAMRDNIPVAH